MSPPERRAADAAPASRADAVQPLDRSAGPPPASRAEPPGASDGPDRPSPAQEARPGPEAAGEAASQAEQERPETGSAAVAAASSGQARPGGSVAEAASPAGQARPGEESPGEAAASGQGDPARARAARAVRGALAATLALEALTVLFVPRAIAQFGVGLTGPRLALLLGLAAVLLGTAFLLRRRGALLLGSALQLAVIATGVLVGAMYVLGVIFAAVWGYLLWLRRDLLGREPPGP